MEEVRGWASVDVGSIEVDILEFNGGDAEGLAVGYELGTKEDDDNDVID